MRRSFILMSVLAVSIAVLGACDPKPNVTDNKPPVSSPSPAVTASPTVSPNVSPTGSPAKAGASPEVKKDPKATVEPPKANK